MTYPMCLVALVLGACGGGTPAPLEVDATAAADAAPVVAAQVVACPANVALDVVTAGQAYDPMSATIAAGQVVRFTMTADHTVRSNALLFEIGYGETGCVQFNTVGTYPYYCGAHGFPGTIEVQ